MGDERGFQKIGQYFQAVIPIIGVILIGVGILMNYQNIESTVFNISFSSGLASLLAGLILIGMSLATLKTGRSIYTILIVINFVVILFIGYFVLFGDKIKIVTKPEVMKYDMFKDLLIAILAIAGVMIAGLFALTFQVLKKNIEKQADDLMNEIYFRSIARTMTCIGYMCWENYEIEPSQNTKKRKYCLTHAVRFTNDAYQNYALKLDKKNIVNEELILEIKNNLACYFAECYRNNMGVLEKSLKEMCKLAYDYAEEVNKNVSKFPKHSERWLDTYETVQKVCKN